LTPDAPATSLSVAPDPRRIHILGGPGSGKSTLAHRLGSALCIEVHELDHIAYEGRDFTPRPLEERLDDVHAIAAAPEWIAEGIHLGWTDELLRRADLIVWLDYAGWGRAAVRIILRFTTAAVAEVRVQSGRNKFTRFADYRRHLRQLAGVLLSSRDYYKPAHAARRYPVTRQSAEQHLLPHETKVVRCESVADVRRLLEALTDSKGSHPARNGLAEPT
jgi:adenylate kinase family enzyme